MSIDVSDLMDAMRHWMHCEDELKKCYQRCDTSPDYFCYRQAEAESEAREKFGKILNEIIDARIEAATGARP